MPYIPFNKICPKTAENETRAITLLKNDNEYNLPKGVYFFLELFCDECDCRRVFLQVHLNKKSIANIAYGWEKHSYYKKVFKGIDEKDLKELSGVTLDSFQYQTDKSYGVLQMFNTLLFSDKEYLKRIEKHYDQFKKALKTINH